jgi:hypothetical protein
VLETKSVAEQHMQPTSVHPYSFILLDTKSGEAELSPCQSSDPEDSDTFDYADNVGGPRIFYGRKEVL